MSKPAPAEVDLQAKFKEEAKDPAMIAYLKSLGQILTQRRIDPDYVPPKDDPRRVVVSEFSIIFKDHDTPQTLKFSSEADIKAAKKTALVVKEGSDFKVRVTFRVQHNVVLGLQLSNSMSKLGKKLDSSTEMLGTYPPSNDFASVDLPRQGWVEAPSGALLRGEYKSKIKFTDDDQAEHLVFEYTLKISKDWAK